MSLRTIVTVFALMLTSCTDARFQDVKSSVQPGQNLAQLIEGEIGSYLDEQGMSTFFGVRSSHALRCEPSGQPEEWLQSEEPVVSIQSTSEGFYLFLSLPDSDCVNCGWRETVQSEGPLTRDELAATVKEAGCVLSEGMEFRLESPSRRFPPMTHDRFLVRFDESGRVQMVSDAT